VNMRPRLVVMGLVVVVVGVLISIYWPLSGLDVNVQGTPIIALTLSTLILFVGGSLFVAGIWKRRWSRGRGSNR